MEGDAFLTVDGAFHRVADLERLRGIGLEADDLESMALDAHEQLLEAGGVLLTEGFGSRERVRMQAEMEREKERKMEAVHKKMRGLEEREQDDDESSA